MPTLPRPECKTGQLSALRRYMNAPAPAQMRAPPACAQLGRGPASFPLPCSRRKEHLLGFVIPRHLAHEASLCVYFRWSHGPELPEQCKRHPELVPFVRLEDWPPLRLFHAQRRLGCQIEPTITQYRWVSLSR
ncbi:hypothetical protein CGRA01v4_05209 [Colletotrichum graminicola]|nr:hypothetical protein CGRA01v4_05209 [Colletotrichum graminicola]